MDMDSLDRLSEFELGRSMTGFLSFTGRIFLSAIFLCSAYMLASDWNDMFTVLAEHGLAQPAPYLMAASLVCEILGGVALLLGFWSRAGAFLLIIYLASVTLILNNFWAYPRAEQAVQVVMCLKNLAIMGGLFNVMAFGAGPFSIDYKRQIDPHLRYVLPNEPVRSALDSENPMSV
jgi:uncharacterized membrane protein YphA (DoxX/SURF4 family)